MKLAEKVEQLSRLDADWTNKYKQLESGAYEYEQRLSKYVEEIERLNLLLRQKVELETRSAQLIQEIERLNNALRIKVQESQEWQ
jgi:nitrate/nitrite-specific signal transduction histidine kinase